MDRSDDTFLWVQQSNLIANFYGNYSGLHVPQGQSVTFDAWTESYDPDGAKTNKQDLKFAFYCRRTCESWPPYTVPYQTYKDWNKYNYSACQAADGNYNIKGCFNTGPSISFEHFQSKLFTNFFTIVELTSSGGSGWSFGDNDGTIIINTGKMASKQWYTLMVVVSKDERIAYQELMFYVSENTVPTVYFQ